MGDSSVTMTLIDAEGLSHHESLVATGTGSMWDRPY
jgi:hypothetical protein